MSKKFNTSVTTSVNATIDSYEIACIIEEEIHNLLGAKDRFIENGVIKERDYRFNGSETIREANTEEIELYNALWLVNRHLRKL